MSTKFLSPGWRMPRNANQSKQSNYSMDFDGSSDKITGTGALISGNEPRSFSLWYKTTTSTPMIPFSLGNPDSTLGGTNTQFAYCINRQNSTTRAAIFGRGNDVSPITVPATNDGNWHHLVVTYDQVSLKVYIDGSLEANPSLPSSNYSTNNGFSIGGWSVNDRKFNGQIDGVSIFNYALSPTQVTTLYGNSTNGVGNPMALPSPPIAYYPLGTSAYNGEYLAENNAIGDYVFDFDNTGSPNDVITAPNILPASSDFTISFWVNPDSSQSTYATTTLFGNSANGENIQIISRFGNGYFYVSNGASAYISQSNAVQANVWTLITVTYDNTASVLTAYLNGGENTYTSSSGITLPSQSFGNILQIGRGATNVNTTYFNGEISNFQVFNTLLSSTEVTTLYNYGSPIQNLANIPQNSNLKAWYKLDASEVYNSSTTEWSIDNNQNPSAYASSLDFNSSSSNYIDCGDSDDFSFGNGTTDSPFSVSAWVYFNSASTSAGIIAKYAATNATKEWMIYTSPQNFRLLIQDEAYNNFATATSTTIQTNKWYNIITTYDGRGGGDANLGINIYVNGQLQTLSYNGNSNYVAMHNTNAAVRIGRYGTGNYFDGQLSNAKIFNTALSQSDVTSLYNNGTPLSDMSSFTSLVSWYKLNNTTTGIQDSKGSNNGTNNGATEYPGFVNTLAGESSGMSQANLVQSDLQTVAPYSKYAMNFDGTNDYIDCGNDVSLRVTPNLTVSAWFKTSTSQIGKLINRDGLASGTRDYALYQNATNLQFWVSQSGNITETVLTSTGFTANDGNWHHAVGVCNGTNIELYIDGVLNVSGTNSIAGINTSTYINEIGSRTTGTGNFFNGSLSNFSIWNAALTSSQVTEIYNEGVPSNLNNHSAYSNLVSWWQLGSNSSFNTNWTVLDEKGSNNGESQNMGVDALTNGVGTTANGLSSGMSEGNLVGDAPYSTANAISSNMAVTARVSGSGNTP